MKGVLVDTKIFQYLCVIAALFGPLPTGIVPVRRLDGQEDTGDDDYEVDRNREPILLAGLPAPSTR